MDLNIAKELWKTSLNTEVKNLDKKHSEIVSGAKNKDFREFIRKFRNWDLQSDSGIPFQLNFYSISSYGFIKYIRFIASKLKTFLLFGCDEVNYFFDDLEIIKLVGGLDILKNCPVHKTPGNNLAYFISNNISANVRWLRYVYFVSIIRSTNIKLASKKPSLILDIGSYYGGFQYVMKKEFINSKHILVDFPHQLSRAAIFLGKSFPTSKIIAIHNHETFDEYFEKGRYLDYDFLLLTTDFYDSFSERLDSENIKIDLLTNFYSLGEMPREFFNSYINSKLMKNAKNIYFCNRYDSSPFYERTYQESFSILDYLVKDHSILLNRSSGIHNYMMPIRKYNGVKKPRPISSGYFELIQSKND